MSYLSRAESMVERGQTMRAFYVLVNGLRRNPNEEHALNLLVDLYIRDIDSPGVEGDLLVVLEVVPNGLDIYEMIHASLEQSGDERRLKSLLQMREREGLLPDLQAPVPSQPVHTHPQRPSEFVPSANVREARFQRIAPPQPMGGRASNYEGHPHQSSHEPVSYGAPRGVGDYPRHHDTNEWAAPPEPTSPPRQLTPHAERILVDDTEDDLIESSRETATTGMFSSINAYLSDQQSLVNEELAQRSKRRLLWIGLAVFVLIVLLVALTANDGADVVAEDATPVEVDPFAPKITEPLPSGD